MLRFRYSCIYEAHMSPTLNRSSAIRCFEGSDQNTQQNNLRFLHRTATYYNETTSYSMWFIVSKIKSRFPKSGWQGGNMLSQSISNKTMLTALLRVPYWQASCDEHQGTSEHSTMIASSPVHSVSRLRPKQNNTTAIWNKCARNTCCYCCYPYELKRFSDSNPWGFTFAWDLPRI